jgi:hypothetical protein
VTKQDQQPHADQQGTAHGCEQWLQPPNADECGRQLRHCGQEQHRSEGLQGEGSAELTPCEPIEGQVDEKERGAECDAARVVQQEGDPCSATVDQTGVLEHGDPECHQQGADDQSEGVLDTRVGHSGLGGSVHVRRCRNPHARSKRLYAATVARLIRLARALGAQRKRSSMRRDARSRSCRLGIT